MIVIDFEASGIHQGSFPIEVAWLGEETKLSQHLIAPVDAWKESKLWCGTAEKIHNLQFDYISKNGKPAFEVAHIILDALAGERVYSDYPPGDQSWLNELMDKVGLKHDIELLNLHELLDTFVGHDTKLAIFHQVRQYSPPTHRAGRDVEFLFEVYKVCLKYRER